MNSCTWHNSTLDLKVNFADWQGNIYKPGFVIKYAFVFCQSSSSRLSHIREPCICLCDCHYRMGLEFTVSLTAILGIFRFWGYLRQPPPEGEVLREGLFRGLERLLLTEERTPCVPIAILPLLLGYLYNIWLNYAN